MNQRLFDYDKFLCDLHSSFLHTKGSLRYGQHLYNEFYKLCDNNFKVPNHLDPFYVDSRSASFLGFVQQFDGKPIPLKIENDQTYFA